MKNAATKRGTRFEIAPLSKVLEKVRAARGNRCRKQASTKKEPYSVQVRAAKSFDYQFS